MRVITQPDLSRSGIKKNTVNWRCGKAGLRTIFTPIFCLVIFLAFSPVQSQTTVPLEDRVISGFGVDGDVYHDVNEIGEPPIITPPAFLGSDDWFLADPDGDPNTGAGVIDHNLDADLFNALSNGENISTEIRMSADIYSFPEGDGVLWIDAVYFRDQRTNGSNKDATIFEQTVNKNFDNPTRWRFKVGSVPQKNDIIDIFGHLRRNPEDAPGGDDEFAIVGASTRSDNGDSYLDFEYYREDIYLNEAGDALISEGTECGRTAYEFDLTDGDVLTHGDVILSFNYLGGGKTIDVRLFVWIDKRDFPTNADFQAFNEKPDRPFNFGNQSGGFPFFYCDGKSANHYGYAQIRRRPDELEQGRALFAQVNTGGAPQAPPWGTISEGGDVSDTYTQLTFAELAINATIFGFDTRTTGGECQSPLGSVLVKSRSSASFDSSLKDAGGPFDLGNTPEVTVTVADGEYECFEDAATLTAEVSPPPSETRTFTYQWYVQLGGEGDYEPIDGATESTYDGAVEGNLYRVDATIVINDTPGCTATDDDIAVVQKNPAEVLEVTCSDDHTVTCEDDISSAFSTWLDGFSVSGGGGEVTATYTVNGGESIDFANWPEGLSAPTNVCEGGEVIVVLSAFDECEQTDECTAVFTLSPDETAPELTGELPLGETGIEGCFEDAPLGPTAEEIAALFSDDCSDVTVVKSGEPTGDDCDWSVTYNYTIRDDCENFADEVNITYSGGDNTPPELIGELPLGETGIEGCLEDAPLGPTAEEIAALYSDDCSDVTVVKSGEPTGDDCDWSVTYNFTIRDDCENFADEVNITYSGGDNTPPELTGELPLGETGIEGCLEDAPLGPTAEEIAALYSDDCSDVTVVKSGEPTGDDCDWSVTYNFTIRDDCENFAEEVNITYSGGDNTPPELTGELPLGETGIEGCLEDAPLGPTAEEIAALYADDCSDVTVVKSGAPTGDDCNWSVTYNFTIRDDCFNYAEEVNITYSGGDNTPPELVGELPLGETGIEGCIEDAPAGPSIADIAVLYTDDCSEVTVVKSGAPTGDDCEWSVTYNFTIRDDCENFAEEVNITYSGGDNTPPELVGELPLGETGIEGCIEDAPAGPSIADIAALYTDDCSDVTVVKSGVPVGDDCEWSVTYNFTIRDDCENFAEEVNITYSGGDETDPEIVDVPDFTLSDCNEPFPPYLTTSWSDNCAAGSENLQSDGGGAITTSPDGCEEYRTYTFFIDDGCGNTDQETTVVTRIIEKVDCETAYGYPRSGGTVSCFLNDGFSNWGWTTLITPDQYVFDLYAGNSTCTPIASNIVGYAEVDYTGNYITVDYFISDPAYDFSAVHVWIGETKYPIKNGVATTAPGQYNFGSGSVSGTSGTVGPIDVSGCEEVNIIVHAVTCQNICPCTENNGNGGSFGTIDAGGAACESNSLSSVSFSETSKEQTSGFSVAPVPFKETVNIKYEFDYTSDVKIQFFDLNGSLLRTYADKQVSNGDETQINIDFALRSNQVYIIRLETDRGSYSKSILSGN